MACPGIEVCWLRRKPPRIQASYRIYVIHRTILLSGVRNGNAYGVQRTRLQELLARRWAVKRGELHHPLSVSGE